MESFFGVTICSNKKERRRIRETGVVVVSVRAGVGEFDGSGSSRDADDQVPSISPNVVAWTGSPERTG